MKKEWKIKWIEALRSSKYEQGFHASKIDNTHFCATGLLFELYDSSRWYTKGKTWGWGIPDEKYGMSAIQTIKEMDLHIADYTTVVDMNDVQRKTFNEIADWIEINL